MARSPAGNYCSKNKQNVLKKFVPKTPSLADAEKVLAQCEEFCIESTQCHFCSVDCVASPTLCQWVALPDCGKCFLLLLFFTKPAI